MNSTTQYDSSIEEKLDFFAFSIDKHPIDYFSWSSVPSYHAFPVSTSIDHFDSELCEIFENCKKIINEFIQNNTKNQWSFVYIEFILTNLLGKYQDLHAELIDLPLRNTWLELSKCYIPNGPNLYNYNIEQRETKIREAYLAFYDISTLQLKYLEDLIAFISAELSKFSRINQEILPIKNGAPLNVTKPVYIFKLTKEASKKSPMILGAIFKRLKAIGYISCSQKEFKTLFINYPYHELSASPSPIIWNCKHYNHLTYLIKCLISCKIITATKFPSNYKIALTLFHDRQKGNLYSRSRERYDGNLNPKDKAKIQQIIEKSLLNSR